MNANEHDAAAAGLGKKMDGQKESGAGSGPREWERHGGFVLVLSETVLVIVIASSCGGFQQISRGRESQFWTANER